jgi:hypothetical protein
MRKIFPLLIVCGFCLEFCLENYLENYLEPSSQSLTQLQAAPLPAKSLRGNPTCAPSITEIANKNKLRQQSQSSEVTNQKYQLTVQDHAQKLTNCRSKSWLKTQATWLRLYPNDVNPLVLDDVLDRIVNRGYNQIMVESFYDGRVMLPVSDNPTPWRSLLAEAVKNGEVPANYDLWQQVIKKGKARGLKVYGWAFTLNFGYGYSELSDRATVLAKNGNGETSIAQSSFDPKSPKIANGQAFYEDAYERDHLFIDPYNPIAQKDHAQAIAALAKRQPDGMLFDYVRYPNSFPRDTFITKVDQLWIYGEASRQALLNRFNSAENKKLMNSYLDRAELEPAIADSFWQIVTNHAYQGVIEFLNSSNASLTQQKIPIGAIFFPGGNSRKQNSFDARMQPWDRFPQNMQRHPMTYAICNDGKCVAQQVAEVVKQSPNILVCPVLAGTWAQSFGGHPSFEIQMKAIHTIVPKISCISHFVYAWSEPESDRSRKAGIATGK